MSDLVLMVVTGAITFASRISFLWRNAPASSAASRPFLDLFPVAIFVAIAADGVAAPGGTLDLTPVVAGGVGGLIGAAVTRRSLVGTVAVGALAYWIARVMM